MIVLVPVTLLANGIGASFTTFGVSSYSLPLIARTGCQIGLDFWYICLASLVFVKLFIETMRYLSVAKYNLESIVFSLGGNFVVMPILFGAFFIYTQSLFESANPNPDHQMTYQEATMSSLELNECATGDYLSQALYTTFQVISVASYGFVFYYIVAMVVIA